VEEVVELVLEVVLIVVLTVVVVLLDEAMSPLRCRRCCCCGTTARTAGAGCSTHRTGSAAGTG